jgi:hypothetical protein
MLEIFDCLQGSEEWHQCRLGIPTASEFKSVLAKGEGKMRRTYMMKLLGERFTGEPADHYVSPDMMRGKTMEDDARRAYAFEHEVKLTQVGFIRNGGKGCSPDSLIGTDGLVEIKTKLPHLQMEVMIAGELPSEHRAQVQGALWVCEREFCDFVSYWPRLGPHVIRVKRDEAYIKNLAGEVDRFNDELEMLTAMLITKGHKPVFHGAMVPA